MKKKLLAVMLSIVVAFSVSAMPASATDSTEETTTVTVSTYDALKTALAEASAGQTVQLLDDITINSQTDLKYSSTLGSLILDLNGHVLTFAPSSDSVAYAIYINYSWKFTVINSSATSGGFVNNSKVNFFKTNGGSGLYVTGTIFGDVSNNSGIKFEDCVVNGNVSSDGNVEISAGKSLAVTGDLYCAGSLIMKDTASKLHVDGKTTVLKNATIYEDSYFG